MRGLMMELDGPQIASPAGRLPRRILDRKDRNREGVTPPDAHEMLSRPQPEDELWIQELKAPEAAPMTNSPSWFQRAPSASIRQYGDR